MGTPQILLIILLTVTVTGSLLYHGAPMKVSLPMVIVRLGILVAVLIWGGFFSKPACADVPREAQHYQRDLTRNARYVWGIDAPVATFAAQIHQESRWRPNAQSQVGAEGLAQFMPATGEWIAGAYKLGDAQPYNPSWAMRALITYDRHLWDRVKAANACGRMAMTLSAYNGGLGWVYRDQQLAAKSGLDRTRWFNQVERVNAGRSDANWRENRGYPRNILLRWQPIYTSWGGGVAC